MRVRRLAAVAAAAALAASALAACGRTDSAVAAYIGSQKITEAEVTRVVDDAAHRAAASGQGKAPDRSAVVSTLVLGELCDRLADDKGYQRREVSLATLAEVLEVPADSTYARRAGDLYGCLAGLPAGAPVAPTQKQLAEVIALGRAAGAVPADMSDAEAASQLDGDQLRGALGSRKTVTEAIAAYDVTVNPRYRPLEFPVLSFPGNVAAVGVPLGEPDTSTVVNRG